MVFGKVCYLFYRVLGFGRGVVGGLGVVFSMEVFLVLCGREGFRVGVRFCVFYL